MKFTSYPELTTDIRGGGHFSWTKRRTILSFLDEGKVCCEIETLARSEPQPGPKPQAVRMTGEITAIDGPDRVQFRVARPDTDQGLRFSALRVGTELLCAVDSEFGSSRFSLLLRTEHAPRDFSLPPPLATQPSSTQAADSTPKSAPFRPRTIAPTMQPPVVGEPFNKQLASLNRQLKRHGGAANTLRASDLQDHHAQLLGAVFAGPLQHLKDDALGEIREFYASETRRLTMQVTQLRLPTTPFGAWQATIGESTWGGVVVVYDLDGLSMVGRTLVD